MKPVACLDADALAALLEGEASEGVTEYSDHLESCVPCQQRLAEWSAHCSGWEEASRSRLQVQGSRTAIREPALDRVMDQLKQDLALSSGMRTRGEEEQDVPRALLTPADRPGQLGCLGGYEVQEVIGRGGMGVVFKAFDPRLNRLVAIKVLSAAVVGSATARRRFTREAQAAAAVCHEHIVAVHRVQETGGVPYLVMQYIAGESLQARLDRSGPLEMTEVVRIGLQTAQGLAAAHAQGLVHRDIKPANLLLKGEPGALATGVRLMITDFGLARMIDDVGLTQNGVVPGTPAYMAPEQARGETVDHRADLYSLGSVLYALCSGVPPFRGETPLAVLRQVSEQEPARVRSFNPNIPAWFEAFLDRLLTKDPAQRLQSAAEVTELLDGYLAHLLQPSRVPPPELPSSSSEGRSRARRGSWLLPGLMLALGFVTLGLAGWLQGVDKPDAGNAAAARVHYDFRGRQPLPAGIQVAGAVNNAVTRPEEKGFRITLAGDKPNPIGRVGLELKTTLPGDFEITAGYEILRAEQPTQGSGVGFELFALTVPKPQQGLGVYRMARVREGEVYFVSRNYLNPDGSRAYQQKHFPANVKAGRLRISRNGPKATAWAAEGTSDNFQVLCSYDIGPEDIKGIWLMAFTGHARYPLDLLVTDLTIRSGIPIPSAPPDEPAPGLAPRLWKFLAIALVVLLACVAAAWWFVRRGPSKAVAGSANARGTDAVACPGCGKNLRVRPELAGKKVKCPVCGEPVVW